MEVVSRPPYVEPEAPKVDPGEGWHLLLEGEPLRPGDGFKHPDYPQIPWVAYDCRPDIFRGEGKEVASKWPWRRKNSAASIFLTPAERAILEDIAKAPQKLQECTEEKRLCQLGYAKWCRGTLTATANGRDYLALNP